MNAEKNATTSKYGQFLPIKNGTFWVKISSKKVVFTDLKDKFFPKMMKISIF